MGPGGHSYIDNKRFNNIKSPREYIKKMSQPNEFINYDKLTTSEIIYKMATTENIEAIDSKLEMSETMMLGLRLSEGINEKSFNNRFGVSVYDTYKDTIDEAIQLGLMVNEGGTFKLTNKGNLFSNEVFLKFF